MTDPMMSVEKRYTIRPTSENDFDAVFGLIQSWEAAVHGKSLTPESVLRKVWDNPDFVLEQSSRVAFDHDGQLVGYSEIWHGKEMPVRPAINVLLEPSKMDFDLGLNFFQWGENTLQRIFPLVPDHAKITLMCGIDPRRTAFLSLLEKAGFKSGQIWQKMLITMDSKPDEAYLDPDVTIITADVFNNNRPIYDAYQDSFIDHRNSVALDREENFKDWVYEYVDDPATYDPSLWFLAMIDGKIAGLALCKKMNITASDEGHVAILGVLPEYRGRGIAKYLLVHAFREYWERGKRKVSLGVDSNSITGANKLYINVGMEVVWSHVGYEKVLRDGEELSVQ